MLNRQTHKPTTTFANIGFAWVWLTGKILELTLEKLIGDKTSTTMTTILSFFPYIFCIAGYILLAFLLIKWAIRDYKGLQNERYIQTINCLNNHGKHIIDIKKKCLTHADTIQFSNTKERETNELSKVPVMLIDINGNKKLTSI